MDELGRRVRRGRLFHNRGHHAGDGVALMRRVGDVTAHQIPCLADRFVAQLQAQLTGQLRSEQLRLAGTLHLDAFRLDRALGPKLLGDPLCVFLSLFDDSFGLRLGGLHGLAVGRGGLRQPALDVGQDQLGDLDGRLDPGVSAPGS